MRVCTHISKVQAVDPAIVRRFRELGKEIKANPNYNPGIGEALGSYE
ncbi:MAG: hypothetical protein ABI883_04030 [Chthoniobacterales bacterium]